jgi:hypothetical protein
VVRTVLFSKRIALTAFSREPCAVMDSGVGVIGHALYQPL